MPQQTYWYPQNGYCTSNSTTSYVPMNWQTTSAAITVVSPNTTWGQWNSQWYQTTVSTNQVIWQTWINNSGQTYTYQQQYQPRIETAEEIAERMQRIEAERVERKAACVRARSLLENFLDDEQKVELERHGSFHVTGSKGRRYCIRTTGQSGNVDLLKPDGSVQAKLCCHPRGYLPDGDAWLMQMIEIRHDEDHFLRTANVHQGRLPVAA